MRVLAVGDIHGNDRFFARMCKEAVEQGCEGLLNVGDFGFWEHYEEGKSFLKWVERQLTEKDLWCWWLDGNHENHPLLWKTYGHDPHSIVQMRDHLFYLPRGYRWEWDGLKFLAVGGAYSVDKDDRVPGKSWWPTECIRDQDVEFAVSGSYKPNSPHLEPVDVLFSHDCPWGVDIPTLRAYQKNIFPRSKENREKLERVVKATRPKLVVHGHYHDSYSDRLDFPYGDENGEMAWHTTQIIGLGCDHDPVGYAIVIDTETLFPRDV